MAKRPAYDEADGGGSRGTAPDTGNAPALDPATVADGTADIERLVAEHYVAVFRYAYRLSGRAADAEDLTQQTFLTAQQKLVQLRQAEAARAWLYAVLRRHYLRWSQQRGNHPLALADGEAQRLTVAPPQTIDREELQAALDRLPDEFKLVVLMFYFEECSYREIASRLEIPIGTVMSRLARAKRRLRARLGAADDAAEERAPLIAQPR